MVHEKNDMNIKVYKITGSHRVEKQVKTLLGRDPEIHSGNVGKGAFCCRITQEEHKLLKKNNIKVKNNSEY